MASAASAKEPARSISGGRDADAVSVGIGQNAEADSRHLLHRLNDGAAELLGLAQRGGDVVDGDEEEDLVVRPLTRADGHPGASLAARVPEGGARGTPPRRHT